MSVFFAIKANLLFAYCSIILTSVTVPLIPPLDIDAIPSTGFLSEGEIWLLSLTYCRRVKKKCKQAIND